VKARATGNGIFNAAFTNVVKTSFDLKTINGERKIPDLGIDI
jgi:hypothetical protein